MRILSLSFLVSSFLLPAAAFAAGTPPPCNFVDQEALSALSMGDPSQVLDHRNVPDPKGGTPQQVDTCTLTRAAAAFPMIVVSTVSLPAGKHPDPSQMETTCQQKLQTGMWFSVCTAPIKDTVVSLVLLSQGSPDPSMDTKFRAQAKRLFAKGTLEATFTSLSGK